MYYHMAVAKMLFPAQASTDSETLYVVEVLLHCSKDSVKDSATEAAKPVAPGETGEMQVGKMDTKRHVGYRNTTSSCFFSDFLEKFGWMETLLMMIM